MAISEGQRSPTWPPTMAIPVDIASADCSNKTPAELKQFLLEEREEPLVFKGKIESWKEARSWSPEQFCAVLKDKATTFKVCPKRESSEFQKHFGANEAVFETQCFHIETTFADYLEWCTYESAPDQGGRGTSRESPQTLKKQKFDWTSTSSNPLLQYPRSDYWLYADYKYMFQLCSDHPELLAAIDWGVFGFHGRTGKDSTLWAGSEGANTPCHYDTYGCNLVAQLWGTKKWVLFPPQESEKLYPTRVPYEESSVFSSVSVSNPDLQKFPAFAQATTYKTMLCPGDVLFVPRHWWHYVECAESAVSVNTWIELPADNLERVKEAIVRTMLSMLVSCSDDADSVWVNPNEVLFSHSENLRLLSVALRESAKGSAEERPISEKHFAEAITRDSVVAAIVDSMLQK